MKRILIIEDDEKLSNGIRLAFRSEYSCSQAYSLQDARDGFDVRQFDLVLLDVNFKDGNGMDYLAEIRRESNVPVIMLTANNMEMDIVTGLEQGANDYITPPIKYLPIPATATRISTGAGALSALCSNLPPARLPAHARTES